MPKYEDDDLLSEKEAAADLGVKPHTLAVWRSNKRYDLPYLKIGRLVKYRYGTLQEHKRRQTVGGFTAKRSVFSQKELEDFTQGEAKKVKVINFLLAGHITPSIPYSKMESIGIKGPYQSIRTIAHALYKQLEPEIRLHV